MILTLGDCMDCKAGLPSLPDKYASHAIMDPPYSERVHRRLGKEGRSDGGKARAGLSFSHLTNDSAIAIAKQLVRVVSRWIIVFCDELSFGVWANCIEDVGGEYVRKGTWIKKNPMPQMSGDRPSTGTEEIMIAHAPRESGRMRWNGGGRPAIYQDSVGSAREDRVHPTQKPIELMSKIIKDFTDVGDLIIDPFAGSGSTGVACKKTGRLFHGWEIDEKYHEICKSRIQSTREQGELF